MASDEELGEARLESLPRREQIRRMRRLAEVALAAYDLGPARVILLAHLYNTTFRIDAADGQRYVLHIERAEGTTVESAGAELAWLAALQRDTTLEVPAPVAMRTGALLTVAAAPGVPQPHICLIFRWLPGRRLNAQLTPAHQALVGELMARLQDHAAYWGPPPGFARNRVDTLFMAAQGLPEPYAPERIAAAEALVARTLSAAEAAQVVAVIELVRAAHEALGRSPATFGLMHADLHRFNLLFGSGVVRAIDFGDCGFGYLLYDPAVNLSELHGRADYPALRAGLLAGYRRVRPLPAAHEAYLDTFIALRRVQDALWVLETQEHPGIRAGWAVQARANLAPVPAFLAAGGRWPDLPPNG